MASAPLLPARRDDAHLWLAGGGLLAVLACLLVLGMALVAGPPPSVTAPRAVVAPAPPPRPDDAAVLLNNTPLAIAPADAEAINAARQPDLARVTPARPFLLAPALATAGQGAATSALDCLAQAVYYEAASESDQGERAVAQVVLNRVRNPLFPRTVCGVVFQGSQLRTGCQFSFTCDGSLRRQPSVGGWARARRIAAAALAGQVEKSVGLSTHYHADYVVPYWASSLDKVRTIGAHIFYTMRGGRGRPGAFNQPYDAAAEAAPLLTLPAEALVVPAGEELAGGAAKERTVVAEDALGAPAAALVAPAAETGRLRADETAGELLADAKPSGAPDGR